MGIRSLARQLDLSIGTVSRALNDRPDVNEATRARVKAAAERSGYVPNQSGRSLRRGCTGIVAAVIPSCGFIPSSEATFFQVLEGARRTFLRSGLDLIVLFCGPDESPLDNLRRIVSRRFADGVIVTQTRAADPRLSFLESAGVDYVAFGRSAGFEDYAWVDFDFEAVATEAVRLFVGDGHRRVALLLNEHGFNCSDLLRDGFLAEARRLGLPDGAAMILDTVESRLTDASREALRGPGAPTAFLTGNDLIARSLYGDLHALGLRVGEDVAVLTTYPVKDPGAFRPALSSFETDLGALGEKLAERLLAVLPGVETRTDPRPDRLAPMRLTLRDSHLTRRRATA
jgi:DNA-binding LacI/PurR family transcriptional regulator